MPTTTNGNKISLTTPQGDAIRASADLADFAAAPDKAAWFDSLSAGRKAALLKAVFIKLDELDKRLRALEAR